MSANRRITLIFGGFIAAVAVAFYPIFFHPLSHTEDYSKSVLQNMVTQVTMTLLLCCYFFRFNYIVFFNLIIL